jgi:hypothetical protein
MTLRMAVQPASLDDRFATLGIAVVEYALATADLAQLDAAYRLIAPRTAGARSSDFAVDAREWLIHNEALGRLAQRLGQTPMRLTAMHSIDSLPATNWFVPWHQDCDPESRNLPVARLRRTVALRIYLDDCDENSGPLEVIPGSHVHGRLDSPGIGRAVSQQEPLLCLVARGDIVAMRPLLVQRSQRARQPAARRVLHLEYVPVARLRA